MSYFAAAFQVGGSLLQAYDQKQAATYNAMVAAEQAQIAKMRANLNVEEVERQDRWQEGAARAAYGGAGVTMQGSPMDELASQAIGDNFKKQVAYFNGMVDYTKDQADSSLSQFLGNEAMSAGLAKSAGDIGNFLVDKYGSGKHGGDDSSGDSSTSDPSLGSTDGQGTPPNDA